MADHTDSGYGFVYSWTFFGQWFLDVLVTIDMLQALRLRPGSAVTAVGFESDLLRLRAGGALVPSYPDHFRFVAAIELPNTPGSLKRFLANAREKNFFFTAIRTRGLRSEATIEISVEGSLASVPQDFDPRDATKVELANAAAPVGGRVNDVHETRYPLTTPGTVESSSYWLDVPILRAEYGRIRFTDSAGRPARLPDGLNKRLHLVRMSLNAATSTLTIDVAFARDRRSVLAVTECRALSSGAPLTGVVLNTIGSDINVDAIEAWEYADYDPMVMGTNTVKQIGRIEMLLTGGAFDTVALAKALNDATNKPGLPFGAAQSRVETLDNCLSRRQEPTVPDDNTACEAFRKSLRWGRYVFIEYLGEGGFGSVRRFWDREHATFVAIKHIRDARQFNVAEVRALMEQPDQLANAHIVRLHDCFYDGQLPVLVMEFVPNTLHESTLNPGFTGPATRIRHNRPRTINEAVEMIRQLLIGLDQLHTPKDAEDSAIGAYVHADIKPENIGLLRGPSGPIWKLLDFGLTRPLPTSPDAKVSSAPAGTGRYMSPQQFLRQRLASNDVYSLGIVLFQVLNDWRFPDAEGAWSLETVERFVSANGRNSELAFSRSRWAPSQRFLADLEAFGGENDLADIVYQMIALDASARYPSATAARQALEAWLAKFPRQDAPSLGSST